MEGKYVYLQRDVKQLTKEISELDHRIEIPTVAGANQKNINLLIL